MGDRKLEILLRSYTLYPLHDHRGRGATTVADGSDAVLSGLELVQQGGEDARARATQRMAQGYGSSEGVDPRVFQAQDLQIQKC